jgi:hypothetical protein
MQLVRFSITEDHLNLLASMYIGWYGCEFGAPAVDCKRPYGNGDVYGDMAKILGIPSPDYELGEDWRASDIQRMDALHREMKTVLQIGVRVGFFRAGEYEAGKWTQDWRPAAEQ